MGKHTAAQPTSADSTLRRHCTQHVGHLGAAAVALGIGAGLMVAPWTAKRGAR